MVIAQVIDSLEVGGAESMAVSLANNLAALNNCTCLLIVSRRGGALQKQIDQRVKLFFLGKRYLLDPAALVRFRSITIQHQVEVIHAHSTSFLLPWLLRRLGGPKLIWHDHHGGMLPSDGRHPYMKRIFLRHFDHVFCASEKLCQVNRAILNAQAPKIEWLPNFSTAAGTAFISSLENRPHAILHLANFRRQKDHFTFLRALAILLKAGVFLPPVTLAGFTYEADYVAAIEREIASLHLQHLITMVTNQSNVAPLLQQADIGIVSSSSEGLPVSLIEYGLFALAVVATEVGEIPQLIQAETGWICVPGNPVAMAEALKQAIEDKDERRKRAMAFHKLIDQQFNPDKIVERLMNTYTQMLQPT